MSARTFLARLRLRTKIIVAAVIVIITAAAIWVFGFLLPSQNAAAETITRTETASLQTMEKTVAVSGTATPAVQEDVSFEVSGTVTAVKVEAGQTVAVGDLLATVDTLQLEADLLDAEATLAEAKAALADAEESGDSDARVDAASAAVEVAQSEVDDADEAMDDARLLAPADGLITSVGVAVSDRVSGSSGSSGSGTEASSGGAPSSASASTDESSGSGTAAFSIVSTDSWSISVSVGETDVANVAEGQQVELSADDGTEYFGVVSEVALLPSTTDGSAQYTVSITITGEGEGLYDGVSLSGSIVYERRTDVLAVPSAAVTTAEGTSTVAVIAEDGTQSDVTVEVGETSGDYTEILSGIEEGDEILVASFTPGEGNSGTGTFPGGDGSFPGGGTGEFPGGGEMPGGGFPGGDGSRP